MHLTRSIAIAVALLTGSVSVAGCVESAKARRYSRKQLNETLARLETPGVVIGEFALAPKAVVDGDTIKVHGLDTSLRLLGIDTEETYKNAADRRASDANFDKYLISKRGKRSRPAKAATPMGEEAKKWARTFFSGVSQVRLERDHPKEIRGRFGRYLAYVWVQKNGKWVNFNVEIVRAGMSPYFTKYSYSRRFHDDFVKAQKEARAAKRGIWNPGALAYRDYDERLAWWNARAEFIKTFEREAEGRDDFVVITHWDSLRQLEAKLGQEVTVLGTVGEIRFGDKGPSRVSLSRRMFSDFPIVFFDKDVFLSSGITRYKSEFVRVTGVVNIYQNKYNKRRQLQLLVNLSSQVTGSNIPGLEPMPTGDAPTAAVEVP